MKTILRECAISEKKPFNGGFFTVAKIIAKCFSTSTFGFTKPIERLQYQLKHSTRVRHRINDPVSKNLNAFHISIPTGVEKH